MLITSGSQRINFEFPLTPVKLVLVLRIANQMHSESNFFLSWQLNKYRKSGLFYAHSDEALLTIFKVVLIVFL